jgi:hypothetical protein
MSHTEELRRTEAKLLPPGYQHGFNFKYLIDEKEGFVEIDGWNPATREAIEICQSESGQDSPKPGQKRKLASDVLKLVFLLTQGLISRGRVYVTSPELYTWFHHADSWLSAACRYFGIAVELRQHDKKTTRRRIKNILREERKASKHS